MCLLQKEVLNLLHTCVVVLTLGTHNTCNRRYFLHISLCLSITWAIVLKLVIHNPQHKYLLRMPFCLLTFQLFLTSWNFFDFRYPVEYYLKCNKESHSLQSQRFPIEFCPKHIHWCLKVNNRQFIKHDRSYQWRQENGTNEVVLVTLL